MAKQTSSITARGAVPWRDRPFLRVKAVAELTGLSRATIYSLAGAKRLTFKVLAGCVVVETAGVAALIDNAGAWGSDGQVKRGAAARAAKVAQRQAAK
jgi:hypothetical protein